MQVAIATVNNFNTFNYKLNARKVREYAAYRARFS